MKRLLLLSLIGVVIVACKKEPVRDYLVLSGKIGNFKKREITLKGFGFEKKISFDKSTNSFVDTLKIPEGYYTLQANKKLVNLYLTKTEDTEIFFDYKKIDFITFSGPNARINNYFVEKADKFPKIIGNANKLFSLNEEEFLSKMEAYKEALTELAISSELSPDFLKKEVRNIDYEYMRNLNNYQDYHRLLSKDKEFVVSENFPVVINDLNFDNGDDYRNSFSYRKILAEQLKKITTKKNGEDGDYDLTYLETVQTEVNDSLVKNDLLFNSAKTSITYTTHLKEFYKKFMAYSSNKAHKDEITNIFHLLELTSKGKPSPKFVNYENYNGGTTSLNDLIGHGKYLYIDVWATWCGFCKREIPLLKRLEQQYVGKNIEFVSISVDSKNAYDKWRTTIEEKEMSGVQLFADKSFTSDFIKKYSIKGLPRFILIDPEGKIISPNAPRPSEGEKLIKTLDELGI
ncbi:TlpA disulfide reductase family protein [Tenacibaculum maritimum]|nr:TlpA disulfide reductase family protein [Tenacibaculum maritimum]MDB0602841.1 TlpA disulfide reductase family protein [Tenacibaculum maritimum]MDB0611407.1 TlpA disulfide reductase family protein [Tenacibaculum maritimum]